MDPERRNHVDKLLQSALDLAPAEREVFLTQACNGDAELPHSILPPANSPDRVAARTAVPAAIH